MTPTPTSEERRKVAELLRGVARRHDAVECGSVTNMLGLEYGIYESVVAFPSDAVSRLADLIDPTCEVGSIESVEDELGQTVGYEFHLTCGHSVKRPYNGAPAYCDKCGARVVDDD